MSNHYMRAQLEAEKMELYSGIPKEACYQLLEPDKEEDTVKVIKEHLRTPLHKLAMDQTDVSIEDMLNGRFTQAQGLTVKLIFTAWNKKLGKEVFNGGLW